MISARIRLPRILAVAAAIAVAGLILGLAWRSRHAESAGAWWLRAGIVLGAGVGWYRWRTLDLQRQKERLEEAVAERTRALAASESALRASQEKYAKAFATQPEALSLNRLSDGVFIEVNPGFCRTMGYAFEEIVGRSSLKDGLNLWVDPADRLRLLAQLKERGEVNGLEAAFRRKDGGIRRGRLSAVVVEIGGEPCMFCINRDVTELRQLEEQLQHAQKLDAIGRLAGGVAHDFNNILTSTLMQVNLLLDRPGLDPEVHDALRELEKDANRAAALTRQLLTFSRQQVVKVHTIDLNSMLGNLFQMLRRLLGETIRLDLQLAPGTLWIEANAGMIEQVVTNLCVNARDAMAPQGGRLTIETSRQRLGPAEVAGRPAARLGEFASISVSDTGPGLDPVVRRHLFEPFFTTKPAGRGTGLGLAITHGIIQQHGGWIEVASETGRGSVFTVYLPAAAAPPPESAAPPPAPLPRGHETVLVVEDEEGVRRTALAALRRAGYRVFAAADGEEAARVWSEHAHEIDLLFSDMVMPRGLSGLDLATRFRRDKPGLRAIVTSGYSVDLEAAPAPAALGVTYLAKPYALHALTLAVRASLDAGGTGTAG
jgi:PAS domain S-box-containing protein